MKHGIISHPLLSGPRISSWFFKHISMHYPDIPYHIVYHRYHRPSKPIESVIPSGKLSRHYSKSPLSSIFDGTKHTNLFISVGHFSIVIYQTYQKTMDNEHRSHEPCEFTNSKSSWKLRKKIITFHLPSGKLTSVQKIMIC